MHVIHLLINFLFQTNKHHIFGIKIYQMNQVENTQASKTAWLINNVPTKGIINLSANTITRDEALLLNSKRWKKTVKIVLGGCKITDQTLRTLLEVGYEKVNTLSLCKRNNQISWQGVRILSQHNWSNICYLTLSHNKIGNKGCKFITNCDMQMLLSLRIGSGEVQNEGIMHLSKARWKQLSYLDLNTNKISGKGIEWLIKGSFPNIKMLNLNNNLCVNDWSALLSQWSLSYLYFQCSQGLWNLQTYQARLKELLKLRFREISI